MPKQKVHKGAAKRFKKTASGRVKHRSAFVNHINSKMSAKRKRHLRGLSTLAKADEKAVNRLLCIE